MKLLPLLTGPLALALAGCVSMSGLDASSSFSCKAPAGVSCQSISGVEANAAQGNLPFQNEDPAKTYGAGDSHAEGKQGAKQDSTEKPTLMTYGDVVSGSAKVSPKDMVAAHTGMPVRQPPLVLRVWVAPYEDEEKDLHDQSYFYTVVHSGRWMIEANTSAISNQYRPVYPLSINGKTTSEPMEKEQQPLVNRGEYPGSLNKPAQQAH